MSRMLRALGAFLILLLLVVGVPLALGALIGNPLDGWSQLKAGDISDDVVIDILAGIAWLAWFQFAVAFLIESISQVRGVRAPRRVPGIFTGQQHLARALIAAIFVLGPTVVGLAAPVTAFATAAPAPAVSVQAIQTSTAAAAHHAAAPQTATTRVAARPASDQADSAPALGQRATVATHEYVVPASDGPGTYWDLAEKYLGSGDHWKEIWALNEGRTQADGSVLTTPGLLRPGWIVIVPGESPADSTSAPTVTRHIVEHVTVEPGDTLSGIAEDAGVSDWHDVWQANADRSEPAARQFTDPDLILPGWQIDVPTTVTEPAPVAAQSLVRDAPAPSTPTTTPPSTPSTAGPEATNVGQPTAAANDQAQLLREVLEGGGALLAAGLFSALAVRRRRQFRNRSLGRSIAATPLSLADVERTVLATGPAGDADVAFLDRALRSLAQQVGDAGLPDIAAVRIIADQLDLRLSQPHASAPPQPWQVDDTGFWWSVGVSDELPLDGSRSLAPFPTLVTVGTGADGDRWLLDLSRAGAISLVGPDAAAVDLGRFMVAELAMNGWSDHLTVTLVGFGQELLGLNRQRLTYAAELADTVDVLTAAVTAEDAHPAPRVIFIHPAAAQDDEALQRLLWAVRTLPGRAAVSVVLLADHGYTHQTRYQLELSGSHLQLAALGMDLTAQHLSAEQATSFAQLIDTTAAVVDRPTPAPAAARSWTPWVDETGRLRPELVNASAPTTPAMPDWSGATEGAAGIRLSAVMPAVLDDGAGSSLLPDADEIYLDLAATTVADIATLAPNVPAEVCAQLSDEELDQDLLDWFADSTARPRLSVLGPVRVRTSGNDDAVAGRMGFYTELMSFLALGDSSSAAGNANTAAEWWTSVAGGRPSSGASDQARALAMLGSWLGADPASGQAFLQQDSQQINGLLTDVDLFRRLRLRGQARGADGLADLVKALELVSGEPFSDRRLGGYGWLVELPLDHLYTGMIVDVAHLVATRALAESDAALARRAAEVALVAGSRDDVPLLDLVAVCSLQGRLDEREDYVQAVMRNHDAEVEEDLPPRTAEILRRRGWVAAAS
ncbi:MAG: putative LysM domain peptidoglycan-binding protein [Frankiales bacterium]|nr:putative LysM domain peptidoglycan-binding protein [Frankiales bacterium]